MYIIDVQILRYSKDQEKLLLKVVEERYLGPGEILYPDIISQKKPVYGGSNNCILVQDSGTKQTKNHKKRLELTEKVAPFLKKLKTMKKNINIIFCNNAV